MQAGFLLVYSMVKEVVVLHTSNRVDQCKQNNKSTLIQAFNSNSHPLDRRILWHNTPLELSGHAFWGPHVVFRGPVLCDEPHHWRWHLVCKVQDLDSLGEVSYHHHTEQARKASSTLYICPRSLGYRDGWRSMLETASASQLVMRTQHIAVHLLTHGCRRVHCLQTRKPGAETCLGPVSTLRLMLVTGTRLISWELDFPWHFAAPLLPVFTLCLSNSLSPESEQHRMLSFPYARMGRSGMERSGVTDGWVVWEDEENEEDEEDEEQEDEEELGRGSVNGKPL